MRNKILAFSSVVLLATLVAACSGKPHDAGPTTTAPRTTAVTTQASPPATSTPNPDVIPPVITVAYVNAVFAVLNHINGDAARILVATGKLGSQARADLRAIYNDPLYGVELRVAEEGIRTGFSNVRRPPGNRVTLVEDLITATSKCIFVKTRSDLSAVEIRSSVSAVSEYWELRPKQSGIDSEGRNPTPWALTLNEAFLTPTTMRSQCIVS
jgi:hypothetical protein